ncbi:uncharacterized protein E0L32_005691 [Thyridium curvatum]|uniref:Endonuclease III homolog n=1 Tax=Thyridium curvatum TaxID=1093900 RepID=A0A507BAA0_9PEZI|nr:uncharacterized protein E0L32_005691 [Thyridium curvatum]TPX13991.1 hypothetical protein E0L32_005691 [Thyridium curvatum]
MRASRVSRETTSKYFSSSTSTSTSTPPSAPAAAPAARPLRRSARTSSLSRFASYADGTGPKAEEDKENGPLLVAPDIEDLAPTPSASSSRSRTRTPTATASATARSLKRKRTTTTTVATTHIKSEVLLKEDPDSAPPTALSSIPSPAKKKKNAAAAATRQPRKQPARATTDPATGLATVEPPTGWADIYALVRHMRFSPGGAAANAPVDTMGCERLALPSASPRDRRFHTLVALMLSSQTKDTVNAAAMARLHAELPACAPGKPPGLNLDNVLAVEPALLNELIGKVGFHNNKTKYIKQAAQILRDQHGGDIPRTIAGLTSLPGVGPKMAHLCMSAPDGWADCRGIGVDVHVHRITNLWGWHATRGPEGTRAALESWLPRGRWREINSLLVGLGQAVCLPVGRRCGDCEVGMAGLCRAADRRKVLEGRRRREDAGEGYGLAVLGKEEGGQGEGEGVKKEEGEEGVKKEEEGVDDGQVKMEEDEHDEVGSTAGVVKEEEEDLGGQRRKRPAR